jgi:hypothetical protein
MLDGLSDAEWRELTELVVTCADDRLASVVHNIARNAGGTSTSVDGAAGTEAREHHQEGVVTRRLLAGGKFYRKLLQALRRRSIH